MIDRKSTNIIVILTITLLLTPSLLFAQKKVYEFEDGKKYFTIELDTDNPRTWGTYRAINHHKIPYFDMTFVSEIRETVQGETVMVLIPTFYAYSYHSKIVGIPDTTNTRAQAIQFHFYVKDKGKKLEFIEPDSITKVAIRKATSWDKKDEVDITSIPAEFKQTKKPKWNKFPDGVRISLSGRLKTQKERVIKY